MSGCEELNEGCCFFSVTAQRSAATDGTTGGETAMFDLLPSHNTSALRGVCLNNLLSMQRTQV